MRKFFTLKLLFFVANVCVAQINDSFSDGDFTSNPVWSGSNADFIVNGSNQLQLSNSLAGTSYLTVPFNVADLSQFDLEWQVYVKQTFASSSSNFGRVYLVSDQQNLTQPLNGYYLQFGEAGTIDAVELFQQTGTVRTSICRATNGSIAASFALRIKVLRNGSGTWQLLVDYSGGNSFNLEASGIDATHNTSSFAGVVCVYTSTNANKFFYDDFLILNTPIPDAIPPMLQSVKVIDGATVDLLFSESLDAPQSNTRSNYSVNQNIGIPSTAILQNDNKTVRLGFTNSFKNGYEHQLSISGIRDIAGNEIGPLEKAFLYFVPITAQVKDIIINEFFPDPSPIIGLPEQEFVEIYNRSAHPFDLAGWQLTDRSSIAMLPSQIILPNEYWIITTSSGVPLFSSLGKTLGTSNFPTLNNSGDKIILLDPTGLKVDSLSYNLKWYSDADKQQGGWTVELLNPDTLRYDSTNWLASFDIRGGTPGKQNSQFGKQFDQTPPTWLNLLVINQNELLLNFNEALNTTSIQNPTSYSINNQIGSPTKITLSSDKRAVTLSFSEVFVNGVIDTLSVVGITDLAGNLLFPTKKSFLYFLPSVVHSKDIIINEFMADPTPVVGLPEAEYIELYNRSTNPIDLANWKLSDGSSFAIFPSNIIHPKEYWIVVSSSVVQQFTSFSNVLGLSNFPSFNNNGDKIILSDPTGLTVDSLSYNLKWYRDLDKQVGGWSLELLNSDTLRYDSANWLASIDYNGGTPGKKNSQDGKFFDQTPPSLISVTPISQSLLQLSFDEKLEQTSSESITNYKANNQLENPQSATLSSDKKTVVLSFQETFKNGVTNSIIITGISDLSGNLLKSAQRDFLYFIPQPINPKDLIITEIMTDPAPVVGLPEAEYIEIFNRSINAIDLLNWTLTDGGSIAKFPSKIIQPNDYLIVHASTSTQFNSYPNKISLVSFPSLNNTSDSIVLKNSSSITIDSIAYTSSWYRNSDKADGGWSMELIDPQNICGEENNWTASEDLNGGTPGKQNSVSANKPDLLGPKLLSVAAVQPNQLLLRFDEKLDKQISATSFGLSPEVPISKIRFKDKALRDVILELVGDLSSRQLYSIHIKDLQDCNGNLIQEEFGALQFALPEAADNLEILVNEILFNPRPNGVDFVEIYNNSPKYINLKEWKLANIENNTLKNLQEITSENFMFAPFTYLALTEEVENIKNNYPNNTTGNFIETNLPSLPDDEGAVAIVSIDSKIIDQFSYSNDFHSALIKEDEGVSLERISFQVATDSQTNWKSASSISGFATPGYLNSNARPEAIIDENSVVIEPEVFSPASGQFAKINFHFDQGGFVANVKIFDQQGHHIKTIANNETLAYEDFLRWDGDLEDGSKARFGYYLVWFEVFDTRGYIKTFRKRVIVADN